MDELLAALEDMAKPRPGWIGGYTTRQAPGAMPNHTRIVKAAEDASGDLTPMGTLGTVLGSIKHPQLGLCYFIEWDDKPRCAVAVVAWKIKGA
jgi:hypothetical protein